MTLQTPYATKRQVSRRFLLRTAPQTNRRTASTEIRHTQHRGLFSPLGTSLYSIRGWDSSKGQLEGGVMAVHRKAGSCLRAGPREGQVQLRGCLAPRPDCRLRTAHPQPVITRSHLSSSPTTCPTAVGTRSVPVTGTHPRASSTGTQ